MIGSANDCNHERKLGKKVGVPARCMELSSKDPPIPPQLPSPSLPGDDVVNSSGQVLEKRTFVRRVRTGAPHVSKVDT